LFFGQRREKKGEGPAGKSRIKSERDKNRGSVRGCKREDGKWEEYGQAAIGSEGVKERSLHDPYSFSRLVDGACNAIVRSCCLAQVQQDTHVHIRTTYASLDNLAADPHHTQGTERVKRPVSKE